MGVVVVPELAGVSVVPGRRCLHGIGRVTGIGNSKGRKKIPQMGRRYAVGWSKRLCENGRALGYVVIVVEILFFLKNNCC